MGHDCPLWRTVGSVVERFKAGIARFGNDNVRLDVADADLGNSIARFGIAFGRLGTALVEFGMTGHFLDDR